MAQQTIIGYIAFGVAGFCLLIFLFRIRFSGKRVTVKNVTGPVSTGDVKGNVTQTYTSTGGQANAPKSKRDWLDLTTLVFAFIGIVSGVVGTVIAYMNSSSGTP